MQGCGARSGKNGVFLPFLISRGSLCSLSLSLSRFNLPPQERGERAGEHSEPREIKNGWNTPFLPERAPQPRTLWLTKHPFDGAINVALSSLSLPVAVAVAKTAACHHPSLPAASAAVVVDQK